MKKVLIQNNEQLELVREEIRVSSLFNHSNLLPLLDHAIISVKVITATCSCFSDYCRWISHKKIDVAFSSRHLILLDGHSLTLCFMVGKL